MSRIKLLRHLRLIIVHTVSFNKHTAHDNMTPALNRTQGWFGELDDASLAVYMHLHTVQPVSCQQHHTNDKTSPLNRIQVWCVQRGSAHAHTVQPVSYQQHTTTGQDTSTTQQKPGLVCSMRQCTFIHCPTSLLSTTHKFNDMRPVLNRNQGWCAR